MIKINTPGVSLLLAEAGDTPIADAAAMLELMMNLQYETGCTAIIMEKALLPEAFFTLSSGLAGEILQKFVNYHIRLAIIGDFSGYTSEPLKDFMYECNKGRHIYFVKDEAEARNKLSNSN